jgi:DNA-binding MarR family transcriptional regulator
MDTARLDAEAFCDAFRALYLTFHRRDAKRSELGSAARAVLVHLAHAGPLTVGEAAAHLDRAQSVVSEIFDGLAARSLVERERDPDDRRRTLVWITPAGFEALRRDREVLSVDRVAQAMEELAAEDRAALLAGARALLARAPAGIGTEHDQPEEDTA